MIKLKVTNKGKRTRDRLGVRFQPNKEEIVEVSNNQYITIKAVKDFEVEIVKEEEPQEPEGKKENTDDDPTSQNDGEEKDEEKENAELKALLEGKTIEEFLATVEEQNINIDSAIAIEIADKNRSTLLDALEELKEKQGE